MPSIGNSLSSSDESDAESVIDFNKHIPLKSENKIPNEIKLDGKEDEEYDSEEDGSFVVVKSEESSSDESTNEGSVDDENMMDHSEKQVGIEMNDTAKFVLDEFKEWMESYDGGQLVSVDQNIKQLSVILGMSIH